MQRKIIVRLLALTPKRRINSRHRRIVAIPFHHLDIAGLKRKMTQEASLLQKVTNLLSKQMTKTVVIKISMIWIIL